MIKKKKDNCYQGKNKAMVASLAGVRSRNECHVEVCRRIIEFNCGLHTKWPNPCCLGNYEFKTDPGYWIVHLWAAQKMISDVKPVQVPVWLLWLTAPQEHHVLRYFSRLPQWGDYLNCLERMLPTVAINTEFNWLWNVLESTQQCEQWCVINNMYREVGSIL